MQGKILAIVLTGAAVTQFGAAQSFTEYPVPTANSLVYGIAAGPDGALWFTEVNANKIGRITTGGAVTEFTVPPPKLGSASPGAITRGPDGAMWFGEVTNVGRIDMAGTVTDFQADPGSTGWIQTGPDGALWYIEFPNHVGRTDTSGNHTTGFSIDLDGYIQGLAFGQDGTMWVTVWGSPPDFTNLRRVALTGAIIAEFTVPNEELLAITLGPDGAMWFLTLLGHIGRISGNGAITVFPIPTPNSHPSDIISGPDGALWFTEQYANKIGRITTDGVITEYTLPAPPAGSSCTSNFGPSRITVGPDGALWFTEPCANQIGRFAPAAQSVSWTVTGSHVGNFSAAQPTALFTITVTNPVGSGPSSGPVTVTEFPPANVTSVAMSGVNWQCSGTMCTRSDALPVGSSYPPITVAVTLASDSSTQMSNQVSVGGGGLSQASATDVATIVPAFADVAPTDSFLPAIDLLRESTITSGCGANPPLYCGDSPITQAEMAVFVVRSVLGGDNFTFSSTPFFTDVPATHPFFKWVQKEQELGIALTCGANQFCPETPVTRGQMSVVILRGRYGTPLPPNPPQTPFFTDVGSNHPYFPWIQKMRQIGITVGCGTALYCPDDPVTRGQMAVFIMRGMFNLLLPAGTPQLYVSPQATNPASGTVTSITIQGQNTNFVQGVTSVSAGPGMAVSNVAVQNATTLTAQIVSSGATPGPRSIVVTTGSEEATLPNGFMVSSAQ